MKMKTGFDNEKYLEEQLAEIRRRAGKYDKLYLEFGGKLLNDNHAARCLPGYDPNVKLRLLQALGDQAELVLCIYAGDIEAKKLRADYGTTYEEETLKLVGAMQERGISVKGVAITRFDGHPTAREFAKVLEDAGVAVFYRLRTQRLHSDGQADRRRDGPRSRLGQVRDVPHDALPRGEARA